MPARAPNERREEKCRALGAYILSWNGRTLQKKSPYGSRRVRAFPVYSPATVFLFGWFGVEVRAILTIR